MKLELVRPDDLLNLEVEAVNLRLDTSDPESPALVVDKGEQPAWLLVTFPPQTIGEGAYFEYSIVPPDIPPGGPSDPDAGKSKDDNDGLPFPGTTLPGRSSVAELAHPSRLVFEVPADARLPFSVGGLLDWSGLTLSVNPIAAIGPSPTEDEIAAAPAIAPPADTQTALELPYRLVISPNRDVAWLHRAGPFTSRGRTELWHTRLALKAPDGVTELSADHRASLRAIWSPDYDSESPPESTAEDPDLGLTAMSPSDRHQLVILTSAFHGYEVEDYLELPMLDVFGGGGAYGVRLPFTERYVPQPFEAQQLMLSPLGGWLRSRGHWTPPHQSVERPWRLPDIRELFTLLDPAPPRRAERIVESPAILHRRPQHEPERLDLSEWVHVASQGRDHYVRIVYEGRLLPFGHRAALVKVTERKFQDTGGIVGAYLMQRMFIVVREHEKTYGHEDRGMPFKRVRLTTLVTPDIAPPSPVYGHRSFWVDVMTSPSTSEHFQFHVIGTDVAEETVDFTIPMMFASISEDATTLPTVLGAYNDSSSEQLVALRDAHVPGQKVMFAEQGAGAAKPSTTTQLVTDALNFAVDPASAAPRLLKADVRIPQVQELLGSNGATTIRLFEDYVASGLDPKTGVFAEIAKLDVSKATGSDPFSALAADSLGVEFQATQAGGFATPNLGVSTLSRELGPLAGTVADAVADNFDPASFFGGVTAQIFGSFSLADVLPKSTTLGDTAPKLRTATEEVPGGKRVITTLDWTPDPEGKDLGIVAFEPTKGKTKLAVHGVITKEVSTTGASNPPTSEFTGKLNDFAVSVLKSVTVHFVEFGFASRSGQKPDVSVKLDPVAPVAFDGDLKFVEELRKAIPPGLFGDGASLDIAPTGIRAGFAIGLPPLAVGVFALKDVSLGAALTLPFVEGKPVFDFSVSRREHPFVVAVTIFGGGGFFHLQVDTAGIKELEAALEFGATASIDIGVASGGVHLMAGIYFSLQRKDPDNELDATLSGYLRVGGSLSVLGLITITVEFNLSFTYDNGKDKAYGRATLTVQVEVAFFSKSVELTVERGFGGSGDPKFVDQFNTPETWSEYALAFA